MNDSSDHKFAEAIRDRLVKQLATANEQLEQFAYVASHDLREPLRTIVCFTDLLEKEYSDRLDEQGRRYMEINRRAARKMESMVADLLEYARLGQTSERLSETDCNAILEQTKEALSEAIRSTHAVIESPPLPTVRANPLRLLSLFQNLLGNALKYQPPGAQPHVRLSVTQERGFWRFEISDNGIGIRPEYLESIFEPFKRLHSDRDYVGTGIGLALCKRIVDGFGGRIWAESTPKKGSVFIFTLPQ